MKSVQDNKDIKLSEPQAKAYELIASFIEAGKRMEKKDNKTNLDWSLETCDMAISIQQTRIDACNKIIKEWENVKNELHKIIQL